MELTKIKGNTFYIKAPTNIGVYSYKNKQCLLIDTGINNSAARKIDEVLKENNLHPKFIINTHSHSDHCGGNPFFKINYSGCMVYASVKERIYMENSELRANMMYTAYPLKDLEPDCKDLSVDFTIEPGTAKLNDEKLEIISLKGHSPEGIAVITPEKVCFLGDAIFSDSILEKYSFPCLYHIEDALSSLNKIKEIAADYFIISHTDDVIDKENVIKLAERNIYNIKRYLEDILELLERPLTKEDLLESLIILKDLPVNFKQYHINYSSMSAFLAFLYDRGDITYSIENGKVYYYRCGNLDI
ncbi:MAG: MBL fold metallo-hydrolase [Bacillota bacterium]|nr:MBL fold metallo-hydrolase [Bacillota bacterium]